MPSILDLRSALGGFAKDKSDEQLLQLAADATGVSPGRIASEYGYKPTSSGTTGLRFGAGIDQYQANLYGLGEALTGSDWMRKQRESNEYEAAVANERARAQGAVNSWEDVHNLSDFGSYAAGLGLQSLPYAGEALLGGWAARGLMGGTRAALAAARGAGDVEAAAAAARRLNTGSELGAVAASYPSAVGDILGSQREQAGQTDLASALGYGIPYAAANAFGVSGALARNQGVRAGIQALDELSGLRGGLTRMGVAGVKTGLTEAAGETFQEMMNQRGRMAVDPNETMFSDAAMGRYKESAIGGGILGGLMGGAGGGWRRSEQYQAPQQETDLLSGQIQPPAPQQYGLVTQPRPLQERINEQLGIGTRTTPKNYAAQFEAAYNEPSGQYGTDPVTGLEKQLSVGEYQQLTAAPMDLTQSKPADAAAATAVVNKVERDPRSYELRDTFGVIPTPSSLQLYGEIQASGIPVDAPLLQNVWTYAAEKPMNAKRLEKAQRLLDEAIINARKGAPNGTGVSTVQQPAGGVGVGGTVVPGTVGVAGSNAPIEGGVGGTTAATGAPSGQAGVLPSAAGQPSTAVTTTAAPAAPVSQQLAPGQFRRAPKPMTVLEAANAAKAAQTQQTETQGSQAPAAPQPVVDERQALLQRIFGQRNGDIIFDVIGMGMSEPDAAAKYGLSRQSIQKIAGATGVEARAARVAQAKADMGLTDEQIRNAFTPPEQDVLGTEIDREIFGQNQPASISETEAIDSGLENIVKTEGGSTSEVEGFTKLQKEIDATLEALASETDEAKLEELNAALVEQIAKVKAIEKRKQAEIRATAGKDTSTQTGEEDAVQVESTAVVPVQSETQTGKGVGGQVRRAEKSAGKGQTQGQTKGQVNKGRALWESLAAKTPGLVPYEQLTKLEQDYLTDLAVRTNGKPVVSKEMGLQQLLTKEPVTIDVESRVVEETVGPQVAALPAPQIDRLEKHYGLARDSAEFLTKVKDDIVLYVNKGASAVAGAIRDVIKALAEGVLAVSLIFNPNVNFERFEFNVQKVITETKEVRAEVPAEAAAKMSDLAKDVYSRVAPAAMASGKSFIVADKPNGMIHVFTSEGKVIVQDTALFGRDSGDTMDGRKVTPAGKFTMKAQKWEDYAGGFTLDVWTSKGEFEGVAVHAAYLGHPSENRLSRLATPTAADNKISGGCINTAHDTFIKKIIPNLDTLDGGMLFILPDAQETTASMFPAETRTESRTEGGKGAKGVAAAEVVGKEENMLFGKDGKAKKPYTAKQLLAELKDFIRADIPGRKLMVVDTIDDLLNDPDPNVREVGEAIKKENAYGVATDGRAFLIADRINKGSGRAKFMHEVGAHLGLENLLTKQTYDKLIQQLQSWAKKKDGSIESVLAQRATKRFESAGTVEAQQNNELLAYFLEEAIDAGIDPTATSKESGPLMDWFRTLWAAFKIAARKLGFKPESLTAQDVVNLAFGAARLEINGTWHGTAAAFRKFNHDFMGTGEGAQAYGWGSYFAQSVGIAKGYWSADVRRKKKANGEAPEGSLMRVDIPIADEDVLNWDEPLSKQPAILAKIEASISNILREDVEDQVGADLSDMTGDEFYRGLGFVEVRTGAVSEEFDVEDYNKRLANSGFKEVVSKYLDEKLGIPALKFLDQSSRGDKFQTQIKLKQMQEVLQEKELAVEKATKEAAKWEALQDKAPPEQKDYARKTWLNAVAARTSAEFQAEEVRQEVKSLKQKVIGLDNPTRNVVVFNDKNIFRIGSQAAANRQRMQFGKNAPSQGVINRNIAKLPKAAQQPVRLSLGAIGDAVSKGLDYVVFTSDLVDRATKAGISSAKKFVDLIGKSKAEARENEIAVEKISDMYALVPEKDRGTGEGSVNRFLFDSTREGKWGYGKYRNDEMGARFDALSPESQAYIEAVFAHGSDILAKKKKLVLDSTNSEYDAMIAAAKAEGDTATEVRLTKEKEATLKRFQTLFRLRDGIPYAPIKRNGSHVVIAKSKEYLAAEAANDKKRITELESDSDHYHVSFTDGKWEARTLQQELNDQGFFADVQIAERDNVIDEMFSGHSALRELTKMRSRVDEQAKTGDKSATKMLSLISQMYLEALAEGSARKSEMRRRGVAGEVDMIRSFAQQGRADANFMASVKYNPQVQQALQEMRTQAKKGDRERKSEVFNELAKRYMQSMDYNPRPWLNKLTRMSSLYYLATSPAYYLQNLTQPWMMSIPAMAGRHDYTTASGALFKAYTELGGVMKSAKLLKQQFDFDKVPADVRDAIKELVNRGKIDIGLDTEIGEFKVEGDGYFAGKISAADKALRLAVQKVESINRLSTAMAAYRLELAKKGNKEDAIDYADRILTETHGDYTSFNAPRAFNTGYGKVALQFRKFQLIQLAFYAKLIRDSLTGADRAAAFKTLTYSLAHTGMLAGLMGMPGYAAIAWIIGALLSDDDDKYDLTEELRKAIGDEDVANLVLRGAPTLIGADISGKVGAGNMLSIQPFSKADLSTPSGIAEYIGTAVGGASLGMATRMIDGLGLMMSGDWYRGIEQTMPKGVSDAMKAYRIANEGLTRRNGDIILPPEEVSSLDTILQGLGIEPVKQAVVYERQNLMKETTKNFVDRTTRIKNDYIKATRAGDSEAQGQAREAWQKLQAVKKENGVNTSPLSELLKAPAEQKKREKMTVGGVQYTKGTRKLAEEIAGE